MQPESGRPAAADRATNPEAEPARFMISKLQARMKSQRKAYALGLSAVLLWSTVATAFKIGLRYLSPVQLLLVANITSIGVLAAAVGVQRKLNLLFSYSPRQYLQSFLLGLLNPFLYYLVLFEAYERLPAQEAQPLNYTWAIALSLLSVPLLKQKLNLQDFLAALFGYLGVLIICTRGDLLSLSFSDPWGTALALGSAIIWALYWIYHTRDSRDPVPTLLLSFLFALPFVLAACVLLSSLCIQSGYGLLAGIYVGVFEMGLTFIFWLSALKFSVNAGRVSQLVFLSPFVSLVFIRYVLGENIFPSTYLGLLFIVGGLLARKRAATSSWS